MPELKLIDRQQNSEFIIWEVLYQSIYFDKPIFRRNINGDLKPIDRDLKCYCVIHGMGVLPPCVIGKIYDLECVNYCQEKNIKHLDYLAITTDEQKIFRPKITAMLTDLFCGFDELTCSQKWKLEFREV